MFDLQRIKGAGFEEALRQMPAAVVIAEAPSGKIIFVNGEAQRRTEQVLGQRVPSELGRYRDLQDSSDFEMLHPDGRPYEVEEWPLARAITSGEEIRNEEVIHRLADGTRLWSRYDSSPIYDDEGHIVAGVAVVYDTTEQKRAEEELRQSEERLSATFEQAAVGMAHNAPDGSWLRINQRLCDILGYTREELLQKTFQDITHPDDLEDNLGYTRRLLAGDIGSYSMEKRYIKKDGSIVWVSLTVSLVREPSGEPSYGVAVIEDIDERKRFETERQRLVNIVENSSDFIGICDLDWQAIFVNEAGQKLVGLNGTEEVKGTAVLDYFVSEDRAFVRDELFPTIMEQGRWAGERELGFRHFETGERIPVLWEAFRIDDPHTGEPINVATVTRDITERKRAEEELKGSRERIENILESVTDAFYAMDREWRFTYLNERAVRFASQLAGEEFTREGLLGRTLWETLPATVGTEIEERYRQAVRERQAAVLEYPYPGGGPCFEVHAYPSEQGLSIYFRDITERKREQKELETLTRQQAVVAELGQRALANDDLQSLMDEAVDRVAETLEVEYGEVVELLPGGEEMLIRAGVGWREGIVGDATVSADRGSLSGYALLSGEPVIVEDLSTETRFDSPPVLHEHGITSGMTVIIHGRDEPFGVLCAHTTSHRTFTGDDVNFLQAIANVLATAIERKESEEKLRGVREAERSRIARNLHDEALRDLTYALAEAQHVQEISEDPKPARRLGRLVAALKRVGQQLRGAVYDLRLGGMQDKSFSELLEDLVELHSGMAPDCDIHLEIQDGVLSGPLGETDKELLRIVGEALTNARRHSGGSNVWVAVWSSEEKLFAEVLDDGRGFDPTEEPPAATATGGMGIRGMRERARALGGDLKIESEPEKGTKMRFELALKEDHQEPEEEVRILLVEDHSAVREAIASTLEREAGFEVVGQAGSLAEARRMLGTEQPVDVAVVDLGLPDGYGGDLIQALRGSNPQAQALVLSASLDRAEMARAVEAGAAGILNKTAHLDEVVEAVRRLRAGQTLLPLEEVVELLRFAGSRREEEHEARRAIEKLTPREKEVLQALAEGLDSEGIARRLNITLRTERNHMSSILSKLGVHSQLQALVFVLRHGVVEIP